MNKLTISQQVNTLAGLQGTIDSVTSTSGYQAVLITMVDKAYSDIQTYRDDWMFMRKSVQAPLSTTLNTFSDTDIDTIRYILYDKNKLVEWDHDRWLITDHTGPDKPHQYTFNHEEVEYEFNVLDADYLADVYYIRVPDVMTLGSSTPIIPEQYQSLIVYKSLIDLGSYLGNYDLVQNYSLAYSVEMGQMMRAQIPQKTVTTPPLVYGRSWV